MQAGARVNDPADLVSQGQPVKVKVISMQDGKIGLSMKEVDQVTGHDLVPQKRLASGANTERLDGFGPETKGNSRYGNLTSDVPVIEGDMNGKPMRHKKRMTSPERWEIKQLIASGAISALDYPDIDESIMQRLPEKATLKKRKTWTSKFEKKSPLSLPGRRSNRWSCLRYAL